MLLVLLAVLAALVATGCGGSDESSSGDSSKDSRSAKAADAPADDDEETDEPKVLFGEGIYEMTSVLRSSTDKTLQGETGTERSRTLAISCIDDECERAYLRWWSERDVARGYTFVLDQGEDSGTTRRVHRMPLRCGDAGTPKAVHDVTQRWSRDGDEVTGEGTAKWCGKTMVDDFTDIERTDEELPWLDTEGATPLMRSFAAYGQVVTKLNADVDRCNELQTFDCFYDAWQGWAAGTKVAQTLVNGSAPDGASEVCTAKWDAAKRPVTTLLTRLTRASSQYDNGNLDGAMATFTKAIQGDRTAAFDALVDIGLTCIHPADQAAQPGGGYWQFDTATRLSPDPHGTILKQSKRG